MFRATILSAVALLGLVSAPSAQVRVSAELGKHVRVGAQVGDVHISYRGQRQGDRGGRRVFRGRRSSGRHAQPAGYWRTVRERVCVPGYFKTVYVPAREGWIYDDCGRRYWGIVEPACERRVWCPERWEWRSRRVWCAY